MTIEEIVTLIQAVSDNGLVCIRGGSAVEGSHQRGYHYLVGTDIHGFFTGSLCRAGVRAVGYNSVTYNEPQFNGHFPQEPG